MKENTETILTTDLRNSLKELFKKELVKFLLKMMPYVFPKVENVNHENGEPGEYEIKMFK